MLSESQGLLLAEFLSAQGTQTFLLSPSTAWMRPTHTVEDNLLSSKATDLVKSRIMFHQIYGYCGPAKLTHKINHQRNPGIDVAYLLQQVLEFKQLNGLTDRSRTDGERELAL